MKKLVFIMPLMAVSLLASCNNGGDTPTPTPETIKRTVSFNIPNCKMYYGDTEISSSGTKIEIPKVNPYYVKFSVKTDDDIYVKPSDVTLDKTTEYSFNKENGDLFINLQSNLNVTGVCDTYKTLEELSWAQIKTISETGRAPEVFHVGDEKIVKVNNLNHKVRIIDFNHDFLPNSNAKAGITFEFKNVITKDVTETGDAYTTIWDGVYQITSYNYDYRKSVLNNFLNGDVLDMLPSSGDPDNPDLREVIKPVDKKVGVSTDEGQNYIATSFDGEDYPYPYLFPLAHDEMADNEGWITEDEGFKYQYYTEHHDQKDRIKRKVGIETGNGEFYWLRSPNTNSSSSDKACYASNAGRLGSDRVAFLEAAVAPAFCI